MSGGKPSASQNSKVDVTFVMATGRNMFVGEEGYLTSALKESRFFSRNYERVDLPDGFQAGDIDDLTKRTRLLVIDCVMESGDIFLEDGGMTTGLKLAEAIRARHPALPIWLLDPPPAIEPKFHERIRTSNLQIVNLLHDVPSIFVMKVKGLLGGK